MRNKSYFRWIAISSVFLTGCATARQHPVPPLPPGFGAERTSAPRTDKWFGATTPARDSRPATPEGLTITLPSK